MSNLPPPPENDQDNADLLVDTYQDVIRYCTDSKVWYAWQRNKWVRDHEGSIVTNYWTTIARNIPKTIDSPNGPRRNPHYKYSLNANGQDNAVRIARRDPRIQVTQSEFDSYSYEINTPQGIVNLKTGKLIDPNPNHLHTKETYVSPIFKKPYKWLAFLKQTFQGDQELVDYMQRLMGLAMLGEVVEQVMPFAFGQSGTGKSTFFETISKIMGGYSSSKSSDLLMRSTDSRRAIASLHGVRMVFMSELNEDSRFDEARLKLLTGNDTLEGCRIYESSFEFEPSHTLFLFGNSKPHVTESGDGVWRRMKLIPFVNNNIIRRNGELKFTLIEEEGPQILAWMIQGAKDYLNTNTLLDAQAISDATKDYEQDEDVLGQFINQCCLVADNATVVFKRFYEVYENWCEENAYTPLKARTLTRKLKSNPKKYGNIGTYNSNQGRSYTGITLNDSVPTRTPLR